MNSLVAPAVVAEQISPKTINEEIDSKHCLEKFVNEFN